MRSDKLGETLLPKRLALPIFASDALSSVAYAPDEIMLMLGLAGGAFAMTHSWQITIAVILVMVVVVASYRQNVRAYPSGGGDYEVATVNLGPKAGLTVASALLVDYVLTVAVSVSSGVQNAGTVFGFVRGNEVRRRRRHHRLPHRDEPPRRARVGQGLRRAGLPLHARHHRHGHRTASSRSSPAPWRRPRAPASRSLPESGEELTGIAAAFLLLRAFSSGCAALTGVEAISNGVPAFRKPKSENAATTLLLMGALSITMLASIITLSQWTGIKIAEDPATPAAAQRPARR